MLLYRHTSCSRAAVLRAVVTSAFALAVGCGRAPASASPARSRPLDRLAVSALTELRLGDSIRAPDACRPIARHADVMTARGLEGRFERYVGCPPEATGGWYARLTPDRDGRLRDVYLQTRGVPYRVVRDSLVRRFGAPRCRRPPTAPAEFLGWSDGRRVLWVTGDTAATRTAAWVQLYWFESDASPCEATRAWG
jgi:hypothetical protein